MPVQELFHKKSTFYANFGSVIKGPLGTKKFVISMIKSYILCWFNTMENHTFYRKLYFI